MTQQHQQYWIEIRDEAEEAIIQGIITREDTGARLAVTSAPYRYAGAWDLELQGDSSTWAAQVSQGLGVDGVASVRPMTGQAYHGRALVVQPGEPIGSRRMMEVRLRAVAEVHEGKLIGWNFQVDRQYVYGSEILDLDEAVDDFEAWARLSSLRACFEWDCIACKYGRSLEELAQVEGLEVLWMIDRVEADLSASAWEAC